MNTSKETQAALADLLNAHAALLRASSGLTVDLPADVAAHAHQRLADALRAETRTLWGLLALIPPPDPLPRLLRAAVEALEGRP